LTCHPHHFSPPSHPGCTQFPGTDLVPNRVTSHLLSLLISPSVSLSTPLV
jgi:hypothetical protein